MKKFIFGPVMFALIAFSVQQAMAEPTEVVVRVIAKDAKFIGEETGSAQVTLRDAKTNKVLAEGVTKGATGNTPKIMTEGQPRYGVRSDDTSAKASFTINIERPTLVTATVTGPLSDKANALTVTSQQWVLPGKPVNSGDAWLIELPGFVIGLTEPVPAAVKLSDAQKIPLNAKITMQCGCPITPGGMWDANKLEIGAIVHKGNKTYPAKALTYAGKASSFTGELEITEPGKYTVDLYAYAPWNGNTGVHQFSVDVR